MTEAKNAIVKVESYPLITTDGEELMARIRKNTGSDTISPFDLVRVTVPTAGGTTWMLNIGGEEIPTKQIHGVILAHQRVRVRYEKEFSEGTGSPPICSNANVADPTSLGIGEPGGNCQLCAFAQFNTARGGDGRGQACSERWQILIVTQYSPLPLFMSVPPASLKNVRNYMLGLAQGGNDYPDVETILTLQPDKSGDNIAYSKIVMKRGEVLKAEIKEKFAPHVKSWKDGMATARPQLPEPEEDSEHAYGTGTENPTEKEG
jgi:hypothetical protein